MAAEIALQARDNQYLLIGELSFVTVPALWQEVQALLPTSNPAGPLIVDLAQVSRSDSSGVALLVAWLSRVQQLGGAVRFVNAPVQMRALVHVAGVSKLLGWENIDTAASK